VSLGAFTHVLPWKPAADDRAFDMRVAQFTVRVPGYRKACIVVEAFVKRNPDARFFDNFMRPGLRIGPVLHRIVWDVKYPRGLNPFQIPQTRALRKYLAALSRIPLQDVIATVADIIRTWVAEDEVRYVMFSASDERRTRIYAHIAKRIAPKMKRHVDPRHPENFIYELPRVA
jgi:hypothetical protein